MAVFSKRSIEGRSKARKERELSKQEESERKRRFKELSKPADYYGQLIVKVGFNRGYMQVLKGILEPGIIDMILKGARMIRTLKFTHILMEESRIWYRIDAGDLPRLVTLHDLKDEKFLYTLERALNRPVKYMGSTLSGDFFVVELDGSVAGIPQYVRMDEAFSWIPKDADHLSFCVGLAEYKKPVIVSLSQLPHVLIAGNTRAGKSVSLNNIICSLTERSGPDKLCLVLIDLKQGVELGRYKGIRHLFPFGSKDPGIAKTPDEAKLGLQAVIDQMHYRYALFEAKGVTNLDDYNAQSDAPLPSLVVIVDELSRLLFSADKELVKLGRYLLNEVLSLGAAAGIHCIICTQDPSRELFPRYLKTNCPARICFSTPTVQGSIAMLGNGSAHRLSPRGRGVFQLGDVEKLFQGPMITNKMVKNHVKRLKDRYADAQPEPKKITILDLFEYALLARGYEAGKGCSLSLEMLEAEFSAKGVSQIRLKTMLAESDHQEFEINGELYTVKPSRGRIGRLLIKLTDLAENDTPDPASLAAD